MSVPPTMPMGEVAPPPCQGPQFVPQDALPAEQRDSVPTEDLPPGDEEITPMAANAVSPNAVRIGVVDRAPANSAMTADGRLRRLPPVDGYNVSPRALAVSPGLFVAPPAMPAPRQSEYETQLRALNGIRTARQETPGQQLTPAPLPDQNRTFWR